MHDKDSRRDYLLNRRIEFYQPTNGYRASTDAVFLAALVDGVKKGEKILDVGSGTGAVALCLAARFREQTPEITGIEVQSRLAELSNLSAAANGFERLKFINADIADTRLPPCSFDRVISNPPYAEHDLPSPNPGKALAHNHHGEGLSGWLEFMIKMLQPRGYFYMINRCEALTEILGVLHGRLGDVTLVPMFSKAGQPAKRILIRARKDSKAPLRLHPGLIVHESDGTHTPAASAILRDAKGLFEPF